MVYYSYMTANVFFNCMSFVVFFLYNYNNAYKIHDLLDIILKFLRIEKKERKTIV